MLRVTFGVTRHILESLSFYLLKLPTLTFSTKVIIILKQAGNPKMIVMLLCSFPFVIEDKKPIFEILQAEFLKIGKIWPNSQVVFL